MCKYCSQDCEELFQTSRGTIDISFDRKRIELDDCYTKSCDDGYDIKYCPFCGREL